MARSKQVPSEAQLSFDEAYRALALQMRSLHIARIADMPRIELYLDQVLYLVGTELAFMYDEGEKVVTGSMVNNYVKQRLVPAPIRKRYTRRHLASLLFVCAFKRVLSIAQIEFIFRIAVAEGVDVERAYDELVGVLEERLATLFPTDPAARVEDVPVEIQLVDSEGNRCAGALERLLENAILLLAYKVYADRMLALAARSVSAGE